MLKFIPQIFLSGGIEVFSSSAPTEDCAVSIVNSLRQDIINNKEDVGQITYERTALSFVRKYPLLPYSRGRLTGFNQGRISVEPRRGGLRINYRLSCDYFGAFSLLGFCLLLFLFVDGTSTALILSLGVIGGAAFVITLIYQLIMVRRWLKKTALRIIGEMSRV